MWKPEHRAAADRRGLRYDSDLTDAEWALIAPLIQPAKRGGRSGIDGAAHVRHGTQRRSLFWILAGTVPILMPRARTSNSQMPVIGR